MKSHTRIVYAIHGGPMAGRKNYQECHCQRIRKNLWQISWLEETNTVVSMVLDLDEKRITTFMSFSHGHWARNDEAKGYKRDEGKLDKWRELSVDKPHAWERTQLPEQATIDKVRSRSRCRAAESPRPVVLTPLEPQIYHGRGDLEDIDMSWPTVRPRSCLSSTSNAQLMILSTHVALSVVACPSSLRRIVSRAVRTVRSRSGSRRCRSHV